MNKKDFLHYILNCYVTITRDRPDTRLSFCTYIDISRTSRACYAYILKLPFIHLWWNIRNSLYHCEGLENDIVQYWRRQGKGSIPQILKEMYGKDFPLEHKNLWFAFTNYFKIYKEEQVVSFNEFFNKK
jgi:hypothetical protein